jgi:malonyl-CoA O-methyltransferase
MFSSFGPDTLREVRTAFRSLDAAPHVLEFPDMHDVGDLLVAAGLADPVVDIEMITLTYSNEEALWRDVKAMGGNLLQGRRRGLLGRNASRKVSDGLGATRLSGGEWVLTFEIIYGHAWKVEPRRRADGSVPIRIETKRKSDATPGA